MSSTREQILDAAGRLIHLRGFNNTSVDDILRESGVGKGNLYYYFKSKDELGYAALDRTLERIQEEVLERVFAPGKEPWGNWIGFSISPWSAHGGKVALEAARSGILRWR